jgi:hypothetical protein
MRRRWFNPIPPKYIASLLCILSALAITVVTLTGDVARDGQGYAWACVAIMLILAVGLAHRSLKPLRRKSN